MASPFSQEYEGEDCGGFSAPCNNYDYPSGGFNRWANTSSPDCVPPLNFRTECGPCPPARSPVDCGFRSPTQGGMYDDCAPQCPPPRPSYPSYVSQNRSRRPDQVEMCDQLARNKQDRLNRCNKPRRVEEIKGPCSDRVNACRLAENALYKSLTPDASNDQFNFQSVAEELKRSGERPEVCTKIYIPPQANMNLPFKAENINILLGRNGKRHRTDMYELSQPSDEGKGQLVLRRGKTFDFAITFSRKICPRDKYFISLKLTQCKTPTVEDGTKVEFCTIGESNHRGNWNVTCVYISDEIVHYSIYIDEKALVGRWRMEVTTDENCLSEEFYVIFNPMCKYDDAWAFTMDEQEEVNIEETVFSQEDYIFMGAKGHEIARPWNHSQFASETLSVAFCLLEKAGLEVRERKDPCKLVRALASQVDGCMIETCYSGNYPPDTVAPGSWTGSKEIVEMYANSMTKVKYGECWTLSGVLTTLMRALGIACRTVTGYSCARLNKMPEVNQRASINIILNDKLEPAIGFDHDRIWVFHCWNEFYVARSRPTGVGGKNFPMQGWQCVDATREAFCKGHDRIGPASRKAIYCRKRNYSHETIDFYCGIKANKIISMAAKTFIRVMDTLNQVGAGILANKLPALTTQDRLEQMEEIRFSGKITPACHQLIEKYDEKRYRLPTSKHWSVFDGLKDIVGMIGLVGEVPFSEEGGREFERKDPCVGEEFKFVVALLNNHVKKEKTTNYKGRLVVTAHNYAGKFLGKVIEEEIPDTEITSHAEEVTEHSITVTYEDYQPLLQENNGMTLFLRVTVLLQQGVPRAPDEELDNFVTQKDFMISPPRIKIDCPDTVYCGETFVIEATVENTLQFPLTNCRFSKEVTGQNRVEHYSSGGDIQPEEAQTFKLAQKFSFAGVRRIVIGFSCKQLSNIVSHIHVHVKEEEVSEDERFMDEPDTPPPKEYPEEEGEGEAAEEEKGSGQGPAPSK